MTRAGAAGGARRAGSGNFFLSLTDLLVGILFLFILLMMTFALQFSLSATASNRSPSAASQCAKRCSSVFRRASAGPTR